MGGTGFTQLGPTPLPVQVCLREYGGDGIGLQTVLRTRGPLRSGNAFHVWVVAICSLQVRTCSQSAFVADSRARMTAPFRRPKTQLRRWGLGPAWMLCGLVRPQSPLEACTWATCGPEALNANLTQG